MIYGYIDESGSPGVATNSKDYFLISLVIFNSERSKENANDSINKLRGRLHLPDDYEFHCSSNSTRPQAAFIRLLRNIDFHFITIAIHKNTHKKTASYQKISRLLAQEITNRFSNLQLKMDSNPVLRAELRKCLKENGLKNIRLRECNSRSNNLIQIADYVANISAKKVKNTPKSNEWYSTIAKKMLSFIEIAD